ncbi:hypothetical protein [Aneurinibacillus migulanus]|uniref:hypothetical protein n=1 Tax=Aneurinibacillus migulanus TaxID=47500 RepID=UPI0020A101E9|nr:hypothetical protein [Aneurinibacillus migulanus]MCP1357420.1 hypothetical protein [Aneurinibacillus migulanus]
MEWIVLACITIQTIVLLAVYTEVKEKNKGNQIAEREIEYENLPGEDDIPESEDKPKRERSFFA